VNLPAQRRDHRSSDRYQKSGPHSDWLIPRAAPSLTGSPGVILRRWKLITRPEGRAAAVETAEAAGQIPADCSPEVYNEGFWSRVDAWAGRFGLSGPAAVMQASEVPGAC